MTLAYWNGQFLPLETVQVSPLDRGYLFGDGVYEVLIAYNGQAFEAEAHFERLERSMNALQLTGGPDSALLREITRRLLASCFDETKSDAMTLYIQVTRGAETARRHDFPKTAAPCVLAFATPLKRITAERYAKGFSTVSAPDRRWLMGDVKSISLAGAILAHHQADQAGALECILLRDGLVTECSSSNVFIVKDGVIITSVADNRILNGISRRVVLRLAHENGWPAIERDFTEEELRQADEIWVTSTSKEVAPAVTLDGKAVGEGAPGPVWRKMRAAFDLLIDQTAKRNS
ncbi:D-amino acid aminotransferase [Telmatospirillum sp.]|uniref:D-amino acid aminotransferase n=1 Tax=Telmatospirillum sp. TaxID=2079197 RepID=UPI00283E789B|nr:D-amino acid aminotransferase [Telmatospirillum sp.]MDR3436367.1 D-amino acid aminotransferase [Telmatospirillum sp.]